MTLYGLRRGRYWLCLPSPQRRGAILRTNLLINRARAPWADPAAAWVPGLKLASADAEPWDAWLTPSLDVALKRQRTLSMLPPTDQCMGGTYQIVTIPVNP